MLQFTANHGFLYHMHLRLILLFTSLNILNYLDRYLAPALLPSISSEFSLSHEQSGIIVSAFFLGYLVASPVFGALGDKLSRPKLLVAAVVIWSLSTFAAGLSLSFAAFIIARVFVGIGEASFASIAPGYLKDVIANNTRVNRVFSIFFAAIPVGAAAGYLLAGLCDHYLGWKYAFFIGGFPGLILALMMMSLKEPRTYAVRSEPFFSGVVALSGIRILRYAVIGYVLNAFALNGIASFVTKYGVEIGFEAGEISAYFGIIMVLTGFGGTLGGGLIAERLTKNSPDRSRALLLFCGLSAALAVPFAVLAFFATDKVQFLTYCSLAELFVFCSVAPINTILVLSCPPNLVTLNQGIAIFLMNLFGSATAPWLIGRVADGYGLSLALQLSSAALFLNAVIWSVGGARFKK